MNVNSIAVNEECVENDCPECHGTGVIDAFIGTDRKPFTCPGENVK